MHSKIYFGNDAIPFHAVDYLGNTIQLKNYYGKKVLLSFFREASCPFCNMRVYQLIKAYPELKKNNIEVLAFFASTPQEVKSYAGNQSAPFPILCDPQMTIYNKYNILQSKSGMIKTMLKPLKMIKVMKSGFFNMKSIRTKPIMPADFLISESQHIDRIYYGKDYGDHIPIEEIINWKK